MEILLYLLIANIIVRRLKENNYLSYRYTVHSTVGLLVFYDTKRFISHVLKYRLKKEMKYFSCPLYTIYYNQHKNYKYIFIIKNI